MNSVKQAKINQLLSSLPSEVVVTSSWLAKQGYSYDLQKGYRKSLWFESIGKGALIRYGDKVDYLGAIYALQRQLALPVHPGAKTALTLLGKAQYLEFSARRAQLFSRLNTPLPLWFEKQDFGIEIENKATNFLPPKMGLVEFEHKRFSVEISSPARAIMECLYLSPKKQSLLEAYELMESLNNLPPKLVQNLLEHCHSIKVKRLFLYMAEKAKHEWFNYIHHDKVDLGTGKRSIVTKGVYIPKYQITVPKELEELV